VYTATFMKIVSANNPQINIRLLYIRKKINSSVSKHLLGTLKDLLPEHGPTRDDVMTWTKEETRIETLKYNKIGKTSYKYIMFAAN
jgi:hypothetical protein